MNSKAKEIIKLCPNYYKIVNTTIMENDKITEKIIKIYEEYVFKVDLTKKEEVEKLVRIDKIINQYLEDYRFKKELGEKLKTLKVKSNITNLIEFIINSIIEIFDDYLENYTRNIYIPRWL